MTHFPAEIHPVTLALAQVLGSVIIITILEHYFSKTLISSPSCSDRVPFVVVAAVIIMFGFGYFLQFYRATALETKRLDAMLRSVLYAHLSESLTGKSLYSPSLPLKLTLLRM
jgi:predicted Abi (CAAX) family protease